MEKWYIICKLSTTRQQENMDEFKGETYKLNVFNLTPKHKVSLVKIFSRIVQKSHEGAKNLTPNTAKASTIVFEGFPCTAINHSSDFFFL